MDKITLLPGWSVWDGCKAKGTFHRRVIEQLTPVRQLIGYLSYLPSAKLTAFTINVEELGQFVCSIASWQCVGLEQADLRFCFADSCYRGFRSQSQPETVRLAVVA
ncbi:MAG: hypothetical protein J0I10_22085 [Verrucomicrobia bacterium]|nr:hypothetical protein [Verrucomicrobiota bacterium]